MATNWRETDERLIRRGELVLELSFVGARAQGALNAAEKRNIDLLTFRELEDNIRQGLIVILDKQCSKCGEWVIDTTTTCPKCGTSLWKIKYAPA